jgi:eukaryotic-like serine/threonine-protein kinase
MIRTCRTLSRSSVKQSPTIASSKSLAVAGWVSSTRPEFQKFLDHRGVVVNCPLRALAYLGLGRAYALQAQSVQGTDAEAARAKARGAYQHFLTLWKGADSDIPILKKAKAEQAKLP